MFSSLKQKAGSLLASKRGDLHLPDHNADYEPALPDHDMDFEAVKPDQCPESHALMVLGETNLTRYQHTYEGRIPRQSLVATICLLVLLIAMSVFFLFHLSWTRTAYFQAMQSLRNDIAFYTNELEHGSRIEAFSLSEEISYYRDFINQMPDFEALFLEISNDSQYRMIAQKQSASSIGLPAFLSRVDTIQLMLDEMEHKLRSANDTLIYADSLLKDANITPDAARSSGWQTLTSLQELSADIGVDHLPEPLRQRLQSLKDLMDMQAVNLSLYMEYLDDLSDVTNTIQEIEQALVMQDAPFATLSAGIDYYEDLYDLYAGLDVKVEAINKQKKYQEIWQKRDLEYLLTDTSLYTLEDIVTNLSDVHKIIDDNIALEEQIDLLEDSTEYTAVLEEVEVVHAANQSLRQRLRMLELPALLTDVSAQWDGAFETREEYLRELTGYARTQIDYAPIYEKAERYLDEAQYYLNMARQWLNTNRALSNFYNNDGQKASDLADEYLRQCSVLEEQAAGRKANMEMLRDRYRKVFGMSDQPEE